MQPGNTVENQPEQQQPGLDQDEVPRTLVPGNEIRGLRTERQVLDQCLVEIADTVPLTPRR
jgi:hypothetical protein